MKYAFLSVAVGLSLGGTFLGGFVLGRKAEVAKPIVEVMPTYQYSSEYSYGDDATYTPYTEE